MSEHKLALNRAVHLPRRILSKKWREPILLALQVSENFTIVRELAEVLGSGVGSSRAAVNVGWIPYLHPPYHPRRIASRYWRGDRPICFLNNLENCAGSSYPAR